MELKNCITKQVLRGARQLHILILDQFFAINSTAPGRRFYEIGSRLVDQGHQVTVITGNSELGLSLGKKKIGLLQQNGVAIVTFNLDYNRKMKPGQKRRISSAFARQAARQVRRLPHSDLVIASSPPLDLAGPAYLLSSFYRVPLIMEIREIDDTFIDSRDNLLKKILYSPVRRNVLKAYCRADSIIVTSPEIAGTVAQITSPDKEITVLPDELDYRNLFQEFSKILAAINFTKEKA